jgi:hypothetical protein
MSTTWAMLALASTAALEALHATMLYQAFRSELGFKCCQCLKEHSCTVFWVVSAVASVGSYCAHHLSIAVEFRHRPCWCMVLFSSVMASTIAAIDLEHAVCKYAIVCYSCVGKLI